MAKAFHEIRDSIHVFIRLSSDERKVLDSPPFQRLRHIHQLALTYLVYPGATHKRFDHSLGVIELAGRAYDVVTENINSEVKEMLPDISDPLKRVYWRSALRMAGLCHDLGHLPFSHAAEKELLPAGWSHEKLTADIIRSEMMQPIWDEMKLKPDDIVKLALGPKEATDLKFSRWETILSEIIVGDAFGVDRMDYLLRDSHHIGVPYGRFDHYRLIDTLRILPQAPPDKTGSPKELFLGVDAGGIHSAEALMLARYFMFSQVYFHPVRRIYDIHLKDFLKETLTEGMFPTDISQLLLITDNEETAKLFAAFRNPLEKGHLTARRIICRKHFRKLWERNPRDFEINPLAGDYIFKAAQARFGPDEFRYDLHIPEIGAPDFPVRLSDGQIVSSLSISKTLADLPVPVVDYVFCNPDILAEAKSWLKDNHDQIIQPKGEEEGDE